MKPIASLPVLFSIVLLLSHSRMMAQHVIRFRTPDSSYTVTIEDSKSPTVAGTIQSGTIPMWNGSFVYQGTTYPFTMVGTDPSAPGAGTSNVPAIVIPLAFKFGSTIISPKQSACGDSVSVLSRVERSPLFGDVSWVAGTTNLGKTQFGDAFQRGNFWNFVSRVSPNYHVMLKPVRVAPVQTIVVSPSDGYTETGPCQGHPLGVVDLNALFSADIFNKLKIQPNTVAIFLAYDIGFTPVLGGTVYPLEGIGVYTLNDQTFIDASYTEPNAFISSAGSISFLSWGIASWMDNPLLSNIVPLWGLDIQGKTVCEQYLFAGSSPVGATFPVSRNGFTYDFQEPTFLSWFARESPSTAVNGWYSMANTLTGPPPICQ